MNVKALLFIAWLLCCSQGLCFSQGGKSKSTGKNEEPLAEGIVQRGKIDSVLNVLRNTASNQERADICFLIARHYADRLKVDSALFYSELIKKESEGGKYEVGMAKYYLARSHALFLRNIKEPENLATAIKIFDRKHEPFFSGFAYRLQGKLCLQSNDLACARMNFHTAMRFMALAGHRRLYQQLHFELANSFSLASERDSAAYYMITAMKLAEKLNDPVRIFMVSGELGELYNITNDLEKAGKYLEISLDNRRPEISKILVRTPLANYADVLLKQGKFSKAESVIREFESICEKLGDSWGFVMLNSLKGRYNYHRKNYGDALPFLQSAFKGMDELENAFAMKGIPYFLAKTELELGQYSKAISHFRHALHLDDELSLGQNVFDASLYISQLHERTGNKDSALYYLRLYGHSKDSLLTLAKERMVIELGTRYETEKKEQQIKLLERETELNAYQLRSNMDKIEKQQLLDAKKSQQLSLLFQQNEIIRLTASEKTLAYDNQQKEMIKKQNELVLLSKENELQATVAAKEEQRKKFAYLAIGGILIFSGFVFYRYTRNKKLSRRLAASLIELKQAQEQLIKTEKEKEAENIRVRISRDIHDEVGATLSGVALFSEIARERMQQQRQEDAQVYLDHITVNSKEMVDKMSDIVWAINPDNDSFERIITKLQSYAFNLCAGKGMILQISIDAALRELFPSMQVKRNLYLFMKEAINNAIKYSQGKNLVISLKHESDQVVAEVRDDGQGFDEKQVYDGNGLRNMRARAGTLDADLKIVTDRGMGTRITLRFDFHLSGGQMTVV
jgi:signal transduction histidine kinase